MNQNPSRKLMQKLENEMLIAFVDWQLFDGSNVAEPDLTKSCFILLPINGKKGISDIDLFLKI